MEEKRENENTSKNEKVDLRKWMQEHPREYGDMARAMGEADLLSVFLMGQAAFLASPQFYRRLEDMIDLDDVDLDELVRILNEAGFAESLFTNPIHDEDWEQYRVPFAAWLKHGRSTEMMMENIEDAISLTDNKQVKWQLSTLLREFMKKEMANERRSPEDIKKFIEYKKAVSNENIAEWALAGIKKEPMLQKPQEADPPIVLDLVSLLASKDGDMVARIGEWINTHSKGIDIGRLLVALIEAGEIESTTEVTVFRKMLTLSFPDVYIVGNRQIQKEVKYLQNLLPNGKRYGKDEPDNRAAIEMIKREILQKNTECIG